jgi:hypothetical protein
VTSGRLTEGIGFECGGFCPRLAEHINGDKTMYGRSIMKNKKTFLAGLTMVLLMNFICLAETSELDFRDYDDDLMRTLDRTIKYFEPDITAKNVEARRKTVRYCSMDSNIRKIIFQRRIKRMPCKYRGRAAR